MAFELYRSLGVRCKAISRDKSEGDAFVEARCRCTAAWRVMRVRRREISFRRGVRLVNQCRCLVPLPCAMEATMRLCMIDGEHKGTQAISRYYLSLSPASDGP